MPLDSEALLRNRVRTLMNGRNQSEVARAAGIGYKRDQQTPHGFRTIASTLMNERGEPSELVELQLAHKDPNAPRAAYNRAQKLKERTELMQRWADYLDELRETAGR